MKYNIIFLFTIFFSTTINADMFSPSHSCSKPYKPYKFTSQYEIDSFNDEVETFKQCINDFIEEMNDDSKRHQDAAEEAIDEWNYFVNYELN